MNEPRPPLSRELIVTTALRLIDRDGLDSFSMRRLGAALGTDPMAIYYHVPNKAALFDAVVAAVYLEVDPGDISTGPDWREASKGYLRRLRAVLRSHPQVLPAVATRPVTSPHMLAILDAAVARLTAEGFSGADAIDMLNCLGTYTIGHVLAEVGRPVGGEPEDPHAAWSAMSPTGLPHLVAVLSGGYVYSADAQYELGLTAMIDGMAVRLATP